MKAKVIQGENKFQPITIELKIETEEQLIGLLKRLNPAGATIDSVQKDFLSEYRTGGIDSGKETLWYILREMAKELRIL